MTAKYIIISFENSLYMRATAGEAKFWERISTLCKENGYSPTETHLIINKATYSDLYIWLCENSI